jgi:AcrR family transcriptional regulator
VATQAERTEATRGALIAAARELFGARGYAAVPVDELVERAGLTTGALYHQFGSKEALFRAVYEALIHELGEVVLEARAAEPARDLFVECEMYLDACVDPVFQRITLRDAPAVLGWDVVRESSFDVVLAVLETAHDAGRIADQPLEPLARMLDAALKEGGVMIATSDDPDRTRAEVAVNVRSLLAGLGG